MKEITTMPVKVTNGDRTIEIYEYEDGFAMTTEFLGKCIGYADPRRNMSKLFRRHIDVLEPHRFVAFESDKPTGGRPTSFYDAKGCVKAIGLANTAQAREFLPRLVDYFAYLEAKKMIQVEKYWFARRPWWPAIRERVLRGERYRDIAEAIGRSAGSVARSVRRMIEVGVLTPVRVAQAQKGPARQAALRYGEGWGRPASQPSLDFEQAPA